MLNNNFAKSNLDNAKYCSTLKYVPLERIKIDKPVNRVRYLSNLYRDKTVLDIGALDETAFDLKLSSDDNQWLHLVGAKIAKQVVGIDNSELLTESGLMTSDNSSIYHADIYALPKLNEIGGIKIQDFEVVIAGEIIEHLPNAIEFIQIFTSDPRFKGKRIALSTPNATAVFNSILACFKMESCHQDHLCCHSYKTLSTLCMRTGNLDYIILPTYTRFTEMIMREKGILKIFAVIFEKIVNFIEFLFPLKSGGYIIILNL